ncbi:MAG: cell division protein ZipA C-terminal FtsZ-binding domain-containing protein [Betaproteobacteria bacterium]
MSNLQIGLAIAGGLVLAGVVANNAWSTRKSALRQPQTDPRSPESAALPLEPQFDAVGFDAGLAALPSADKRVALDALIDVIAAINLEAPVSGEAALAALPATRRVGSKPFGLEGLNDATMEWEPSAAGQRYSAFQTGVQLANRTGALNEIEFSEFVQKTQAFADVFNATPEFPDMRHEVARAKELDQFASAHDAQLGFTLRAKKTAWSPGYVQQHAARRGFVAGALPGRMVLPASEPGLPPVLDLSFDTHAAMSEDPAQSAIHSLTLSLDVPQVRPEEQAFERMCDVAIALASSMDGLITDDNGHVIPISGLALIGADLEHLYASLAEHDLAAGSVLARRLFS